MVGQLGGREGAIRRLTLDARGHAPMEPMEEALADDAVGDQAAYGGSSSFRKEFEENASERLGLGTHKVVDDGQTGLAGLGHLSGNEASDPGRRILLGRRSDLMFDEPSQSSGGAHSRLKIGYGLGKLATMGMANYLDIQTLLVAEVIVDRGEIRVGVRTDSRGPSPPETPSRQILLLPHPGAAAAYLRFSAP